MSDYAGSRPQTFAPKDFPKTEVPEEGFYPMHLVSFGKPYDLTDKCQECKSRGTVEGETCRKCQGSRYVTRRIIRLRYETDGFPTFAEEDLSFKISDQWTTKSNPPRTVSASMLFLRLREFTGINDADMLADIIEDDHDRNSLLGTACKLTIIASKSGKYLRIAGVKRLGPVRLRSAVNRQAFEGRPSQGLTHVSAIGNGLPEPPPVASDGPPSDETPSEALAEPESEAPTPSIADLQKAYTDTGRPIVEFPLWFKTQTGYAKTVSAQTKRDLAKMIAALPHVESRTTRLANQAGIELAEEDEPIPF